MISLVNMDLFCSSIKRVSASLLIFPFLWKVFSCVRLLVCFNIVCFFPFLFSSFCFYVCSYDAIAVGVISLSLPFLEYFSNPWIAGESSSSFFSWLRVYLFLWWDFFCRLWFRENFLFFRGILFLLLVLSLFDNVHFEYS